MADDSSADRSDRSSGHLLWRHSCAADAPDDQTARFLDLAAFAEGRLDADDGERIEALMHHDSALASDVAAARELLRHEHRAAPEAIMARACALVAPAAAAGEILPFPARLTRARLPAMAQWASLAAAVLVASWLGFAMGSDTSAALGQPTQATSDDGFLQEFLDPSIGFMRDLTESAQT